MTNIQITPKHKDVNPSGYYVYLHRRLSDGLVMHVGKGTRRRGWSKSGRNEHWVRAAIKHGCIIEIVSDGMSEPCAFTKEKILIAKYRSLGHPLTNMTDGGEGVSGLHRAKTIDERIKFRNAYGIGDVCCSNGMKFHTTRDAVDWLLSAHGIKAFSSAINLACNGGIYTAYGYAWWREGSDEKKVLDGRKLHGERNKKAVQSSDGIKHKSATDAAAYLKKIGYSNASSSAISAACRGRIGSAYGRSWWYDGDDAREYIPRYTRLSITCRGKK